VDSGPRFVDEEFRNPAIDGLERSRIEAPSMAAIGWIPYYGVSEAFGELPLRKRREDDLATRLLFASGNPEPQREFSGETRFMDRLRLDDFRASVSLRRPSLAIDSQRRPVAVRVGEFHRVGRTPIPFGRERLQIQLSGRDNTPPSGRRLLDVRFRRDGVEIRFESLFKLGVLADMAGALLTKKLAPFAWIELAYWIGCEGAARLEIRSSVIPSVHWYVEEMDSYGRRGPWSRKDGTEMERIEDVEFEKFVDTDYRTKGPTGKSFDAYAVCYKYALVMS